MGTGVERTVVVCKTHCGVYERCKDEVVSKWEPESEAEFAEVAATSKTLPTDPSSSTCPFPTVLSQQANIGP